MYIGYDQKVITPDESESFTMDFVNDVPSGVTISSCIWRMAVVTGTDASPSSHLSGPSVNAGTRSSQRVGPGCVNGVTYMLEARAVMSNGNVESLHTHLPCESPA